MAVALGLVGALRLSPLLQSGFTLPGTDSARVDQVLARAYPARSASPFVLVAEGPGAHARVRTAARRATRALPGGKLDRVLLLPSGGAAAFVTSRLTGGAAEAEVTALRRAVGQQVVVTGDAAVQHDLAPVLARELRVGELYLALPAALVILVLAFSTASILLPFLFAGATIPPALGIAWGAAHFLSLSDYLRNMVLMIGLGIAIDYSLLVVSRYRDERRRGRTHLQAVDETMHHTGRTILFSALVVSLGLALMLLLPVPFLRGFGLGGLLIPAVSLVCALTLLPVMLAALGERFERAAFLPASVLARRHEAALRLWTAHARWVIRRAKVLAPAVAVVLCAAALPVLGLHVGPASTASVPPNVPAARGLADLQRGAADALDPIAVLVDTHGRDRPAVAAAVVRLDRLLRRDGEVASVSAPVRSGGGGRYLELDVVGRHDPASPQAQALAGRLRSRLIPAARFPALAQVIAGGGGAYARDFLSRTLGYFPWLVLGVLALSYLLLVRAFRSLVLPLKAIVLNLLTVGAASGLMVAMFQWGWGSWAGLVRVSQVEGWIPVFMFTLLFGLSMDYEVFLVTRMREAWHRTRSNSAAVVDGLASTGHVVTAAGLIMATTFSGLMLAKIPPMQQLGFGLASAIVIDITLVRGLLLPATMAIAGRWNWYLPGWTARVLRLPAP